MSSLPVYALSFFKAPSGIISSIEYIFKKKMGREGGSQENFLDCLELSMLTKGEWGFGGETVEGI